MAYALARMPATYAAVAACLTALQEARPDFAPHSLLDVGAGPGTASFAAAEAFSSLATFTLLDANPVLRLLALDLARAGGRELKYGLGEARALIPKAEPADLVVASYLIGELSEAGTPAGYARIIATRAQLIAASAHVLAPCPHDAACPLQSPDWCHFAQRLPRSRAHKQVKGAELPFEDEKFSYVALARKPAAHRPARVLARPHISKVEVTAKLCTTDGLVRERIPHRDRRAYAAARRWRWGDAAMEKR